MSGLGALTGSGAMRPPCSRCLDSVKEDGQWAWLSDAAYESVSSVDERAAAVRRGESVACVGGGVHLRGSAGRVAWERLAAAESA